MVIVLIGPMGCGKSTVGGVLSVRLGWRFEDGDDFHPEQNKIKMQKGLPLDDDDRLPWLYILRDILKEAKENGDDLILACSALKRRYRRILGIDQQAIHSVYLMGTEELLRQRITSRSHEYMSNSLLSSQLETLEEPETGLTIEIDASPADIVEKIINELHIQKNQ